MCCFPFASGLWTCISVLHPLLLIMKECAIYRTITFLFFTFQETDKKVAKKRHRSPWIVLFLVASSLLNHHTSYLSSSVCCIKAFKLAIFTNNALCLSLSFIFALVFHYILLNPLNIHIWIYQGWYNLIAHIDLWSCAFCSVLSCNFSFIIKTDV